MDTKMKDGGAAFPQVSELRENTSDISKLSGMSLRDWFAGQALIGLIPISRSSNWNLDAAEAYKISDAMLRARTGKDSQ